MTDSTSRRLTGWAGPLRQRRWVEPVSHRDDLSVDGDRLPCRQLAWEHDEAVSPYFAIADDADCS
ncbi:MAG: hypothetical protein LC808_34370 [Actinobacteria bacterium]|nr:hypothetical protein [Actinomycetota bacterium]